MRNIAMRCWALPQFRIPYSAFRIYFNFQSVVGEHHAFGQHAVGFGGKANMVAAMREPCLLRPYPLGRTNGFFKREVGIVLFVAQCLNNQVINALQPLDDVIGNLA